MGLFSFLSQELAMDLGTANTIIIHNDKIVVDEPSIVALDRRSDKLVAIGEKARQMHGQTHDNIYTIRPLRDGVIADFKDRKSTRLNSSHVRISYAVFCLIKKTQKAVVDHAFSVVVDSFGVLAYGLPAYLQYQP